LSCESPQLLSPDEKERGYLAHSHRLPETSPPSRYKSLEGKILALLGFACSWAVEFEKRSMRSLLYQKIIPNELNFGKGVAEFNGHLAAIVGFLLNRFKVNV